MAFERQSEPVLRFISTCQGGGELLGRTVARVCLLWARTKCLLQSVCQRAWPRDMYILSQRGTALGEREALAALPRAETRNGESSGRRCATCQSRSMHPGAGDHRDNQSRAALRALLLRCCSGTDDLLYVLAWTGHGTTPDGCHRSVRQRSVMMTARAHLP
jgi:hypothetical protein